jgi:hypothetical protein
LRRRFLDPEKTLADNRVRQNATVVAARVGYTLSEAQLFPKILPTQAHYDGQHC